jgi:hypothetical protein
MLDPETHGFLASERCTLDRPVLRDPELQAVFEDRGYVTIPLLDPDEVETLVAGYDRLSAEVGGASEAEAYDDTYAEFSIIHSRPEFRRRAFELLSSVLVPAIDRHVVDHRPLIANYVNKPSGTGVVPTHQNFSVVDEAQHRSVSVWVALVDCDLANGAMRMLDGSHRNLRGRRGMWAYQAFSHLPQDELDQLMAPLPVRAGEAVVLDDALLHSSPPNLTAARRLAIQFVMVPEEATPLWFQQTGGDDGGIDVAVWEIDERYFFEFWHGDGDETYASQVDQLRLPSTRVDLPALQALLDGSPPPPAPATAVPEPAPAPAPVPPQRGLRALISRFSR